MYLGFFGSPWLGSFSQQQTIYKHFTIEWMSINDNPLLRILLEVYYAYILCSTSSYMPANNKKKISTEIRIKKSKEFSFIKLYPIVCVAYFTMSSFTVCMFLNNIYSLIIFYISMAIYSMDTNISFIVVLFWI